MTPPFRSAIQSLGSFTLLPPLTKSLVDLFASLGNAPSAVSTEAFTSALKWGPVSRQQDVHEFWTLLCERLQHLAYCCLSAADIAEISSATNRSARAALVFP